MEYLTRRAARRNVLGSRQGLLSGSRQGLLRQDGPHFEENGYIERSLANLPACQFQDFVFRCRDPTRIKARVASIQGLMDAMHQEVMLGNIDLILGNACHVHTVLVENFLIDINSSDLRFVLG